MEAYQERMIEERDQLNERLGKLRGFIVTKNFRKIAIEEQRRLCAQSEAMSQYLDILNERIKAFTNVR